MTAHIPPPPSTPPALRRAAWRIERERIAHKHDENAPAYPDTSEAAQEYRAQLDAHDDAVLAALPAEQFAARVHAAAQLASQTQTQRAPHKPPFLLWAGPALAGAAALAFVISDISTINDANQGISQSQHDLVQKDDNLLASHDGKNDTVRSKGMLPLMRIYRVDENSGESERLSDGDVVKNGDVLQISYVSPKETRGSIFSIDGAGQMTWHYPTDREGVLPLHQGREVLLPTSYQLDNAPRFEKFFLVTPKADNTSATDATSVPAFTTTIVTQAARLLVQNEGDVTALDALSVQERFDVFSVVLRKE